MFGLTRNPHRTGRSRKCHGAAAVTSGSINSRAAAPIFPFQMPVKNAAPGLLSHANGSLGTSPCGGEYNDDTATKVVQFKHSQQPMHERAVFSLQISNCTLLDQGTTEILCHFTAVPDPDACVCSKDGICRVLSTYPQPLH